MASRMKMILDKIIEHQKRVSPAAVPSIRAKLILKGIHPDQVTDTTPDDPRKILELETLARNLNVII